MTDLECAQQAFHESNERVRVAGHAVRDAWGDWVLACERAPIGEYMGRTNERLALKAARLEHAEAITRLNDNVHLLAELEL